MMPPAAPVPSSARRARPWSAQRDSDSSGTGFAFFALCVYLLSQCFEIPLIAIGPSWAVWPVLSDVAVGLMLAGWVFGRRRLWIRHRANGAVFGAVGLAVAAMCAAFLLSSLRSVLSVGDYERGTSFGLFQVYRMLEFLIVFRVTAGVPLTPRRVLVLSRIAGIALVGAFVGIIGTYTGALPTPTLVAHLPSDINLAGPWVVMSNGQWHEAGTIGHNHSYTSVQLLMLGALALGLRVRKRHPAYEAACLLMSAAGVFLSGSRAGMAAAIVFVLAIFARKPASALLAVLVCALLLAGYWDLLGDMDLGIGETAQRQLTLARANDPENLSGRAGIWADTLALLAEDPVRWVTGVGPGLIAETGYNAHMLYLHIVVEGGLIGLLIFAWAMWRILKTLHTVELWEKPIFWASIALLVSSVTQETLYPVPAMGHFLGLYFCAVALAVSAGEYARKWQSGSEVA